jgi:hypothetical protein
MGFVDDFDRAMDANLARWRAADVAESTRQREEFARNGFGRDLDRTADAVLERFGVARGGTVMGEQVDLALEAIRAPFGQKPLQSPADIAVGRAFGRISEAEAEQAMAKLREAAVGATGRVLLQESTAKTPTLVGGRRIRVTLIDPGHGSSGYYPAATLEAAARDKVFPEGLPIYLDHPSTSEAHERPERSVRDLAGLLVEDAKWSGSALVAEARIVPAHAELVASLEGIAGMSIRAQGEMEPADIDGRRVRKITKLVAAESVDIVTKAGRGGRFEVLEGAR